MNRAWAKRDSARAPHVRAQGRMMGAHLVWLTVDCKGDMRWHREQYNEANLPRPERKAQRLKIAKDPSFSKCFEKERDPFSSESDGEPLSVVPFRDRKLVS